MRRGRKKDLTIPPTRALLQQRDYRARKANYMGELEERVRKVEEENARLRRDLEAARAGLAVPAVLLNPQVVEASRELMQHLSLATSSLAHFQQTVFPEGPHPPALPSALSGAIAQPNATSFPSLKPSPRPTETATQFSNQTEGHLSSAVQTLSSSLPPPAPYPSDPPRPHREDSPKPSLHRSRLSPTPESECCGGILDCQELVEEEEGTNDQVQLVPERLSDMRSTSERPFYTQEDRF